MELTANGAINAVFSYIKTHIDPRATVSRKTGEPVIHYAVENGKIHHVRKEDGIEVPFKLVRKIDTGKARQICFELNWTHDNQRG